jgi:ParB family chromosome partitioning protein
MASPKGLGKGLGALLGDDLDISGEETPYRQLPIYRVEPNPEQPRQDFDPEELQALADSISVHGIIQPLTVRELNNGYYQIIAGERRWRAARMAQLNEVPVIIIKADEKKIAEIALIENLQREDLNPMEEAAAYRSLMKEHAMTQEELSQRVGKSRSAIANSTRLLDLPDEVADMVASGALSAGHARTLLGLTKKEDIARAADAVITRELSVRATEALVKTLNSAAAKADAPEKVEKIRVDYAASLAKKVEDVLGRHVKITAKGNSKRIEISFASNEDLEELLKMICGDEFFDDI